MRRVEEVRAEVAVEQQHRHRAPRAPAARAISRNAYVRIPHTNSGMRIHVMPGARMFMIVVMKLTAPASDESR